MATPQPALVPCPEREELIQLFLAALERVIAIGHGQIDAVPSGDPAAILPLGTEFEEAVRFKNGVLKRFQKHIREHGCCSHLGTDRLDLLKRNPAAPQPASTPDS